MPAVHKSQSGPLPCLQQPGALLLSLLVSLRPLILLLSSSALPLLPKEAVDERVQRDEPVDGRGRFDPAVVGTLELTDSVEDAPLLVLELTLLVLGALAALLLIMLLVLLMLLLILLALVLALVLALPLLMLLAATGL